MSGVDWPLVVLQAITATVMVISLFGLMIPFFPGLVVIWAAALVFGLLVSGYNWLGWLVIILLTLLMIFGSVIDNIITAKKVHDTGAAISSIVIGVIAGVVGGIFWTPIGGLILAPVAVLLAEYRRVRNFKQAARATSGWLIGLGWAFVLRFLTGMAMIGLWLIWAINLPK
jgi:hypothetical protein